MASVTPLRFCSATAQIDINTEPYASKALGEVTTQLLRMREQQHRRALGGGLVNWQLLAAGGVMLIGASLHGGVGDQVLKKIGRLDLPPNAFGSPADTRIALRITWHFGTIAFAVVAGWLIAAGLRPRADFSIGAAYLSGTLLSCFGLIAGSVRVYRHGLVSLAKHPAIMLILSAILAWWGSTSL
jgi:hypothetical protein